MIRRPKMFTTVKPEARRMMRDALIEDLVRRKLLARFAERSYLVRDKLASGDGTIRLTNLVFRSEALS